MRFIVKIGIVCLLSTSLFSTLHAQKVVASIALQADRLLPKDRNILEEIPARLEEYINSYDWSGDNQNIEVICRFNLVIEAASDRGSEQVFRGQLITNTPSGENYVDRACEFVYQQGQSMSHDESLFNPLLALVDYYIYMMIGGELDTYFQKGGNFFFDRARNIADQGLVSNYKLGWTARAEEVGLVTDADHSFLREAKFYFFEGLFYVEARQDADRSPKYSTRVVDLLEKTFQKRPNSKVLKRFLDAHNLEFCKLFSFDADEANANRMMAIDNRRREVYEACAEQKDLGRKRLQ